MVGNSYPSGGKLLLLADHGVFINMMMMPRETDNLPFAMKTFTWLREGRKGERHQALFFEENGRINPDFKVPLRRLPNMDLPEIKPEDLPILIGQADRILSGLESDNVFDTYLMALTQLAPGSRTLGPDRGGERSAAVDLGKLAPHGSWTPRPDRVWRRSDAVDLGKLATDGSRPLGHDRVCERSDTV